MVGLKNKPLLFVVYCMCNEYILQSTYKKQRKLVNKNEL